MRVLGGGWHVEEVGPIHLWIGRIGVNRIQSNLVFLDVGIVQRFVIMQVTGDLNPGWQAFGKKMLVTEVLLVFLERTRLNVSAKVIKLLRPFVSQLDDQKEDSARDGEKHVPPISVEAPHLERRP